MKKDEFVIGTVPLTKENKAFAEDYDKQQSIFRTVTVSTDSSYTDVSKSAREEFDALKRAKLEYQKILSTLNEACKTEFQEWVRSQSTSASLSSVKAK